MSRLFENTRREFFKIYDDWTFHYLTEDSKNALIAVLNTILNRKTDPIVSIQIMNPDDYSEANTQKKSILDIKAKTDIGELIDVEIQNGNLLFFANGSIYYCAKMINSSSDSGEDYGNIKKYYDYNRKRQNVSGLRLASHQFSFSGRCRTISPFQPGRRN